MTRSMSLRAWRQSLCARWSVSGGSWTELQIRGIHRAEKAAMVLRSESSMAAWRSAVRGSRNL